MTKETAQLGKGLLFASLVIGSLIILNNFLTKNFREDDPLSVFKRTIENAPEGIYFIGSSRVQASVDPSILKKLLGQQHVYNLGVLSSTFLGNCIIARRLMRSNKLKKTIFIELSPLVPYVAPTIIEQEKELNLRIYDTAKPMLESASFNERVMFLLNITNYSLLDFFLIGHNARRLVGFYNSTTGFHPWETSTYNSYSSFLRPEDLETYEHSPCSKEYKRYISLLIREAHLSNTQLAFFLPINYRSKKEKAVVIPIFRSLPAYCKLKLSGEFLNEMSNPQYLSDVIHLNSRGSSQYSILLVEEIKRFKSN